MTHGATFFSAVTGAPWDDAVRLARVLGVPLAPESAAFGPAQARALWKELSYLGSNDLAYLLRGFEGVDYPEIVRDVCRKLKIPEAQPGEEERVVELNEQLVLGKVFAEAWQQLDADQRRELLRELNLDESHLPLAGAAVANAVLAGKAGPFAVYKLSLIVANSVARALPARRLTPARRKAAQAVVLVASLRQAKRTALAETALAGSALADPALSDSTLADSDAPADAPGASSAPPERSRRPARKQAAKGTSAPEKQPTKKKPGKAAARAQRSAKKAGRKKAASQQTAGKKAVAKKAVAKRAASKKAVSKPNQPAPVKNAKKKPATRRRSPAKPD